MKKVLFTLVLALSTLFATSQIIVSGDITTNTTWTNNNIYILDGWVYVKAGATLTIEPGTIIKGDFITKGALIIERDADIIADGTAEQPIVFTSQKAIGQRNYGDWGGLILCGRASVNSPANAGNGTEAGEAIIEGGVGSIYGGGATPDDNDNSGIVRYVRIEYGGIPFQPNSEINGLTMGGVGRGTIIENVQVSYSGDDAFEWFGGTVNCKNLIAFRNWDDDFDTDFGYTGNVQFAMSVRDPSIADQSGSNGFESDNDATGTTNTPFTHPKFSNVTIIGPLVNNTTINTNYKRALHLRRNTRTSVFNSVFAGYPTGLLIDGSTTHTNALNNDLRFKNNLIVQMTDSLATTSSGNPNNVTGAFNISDWFATSGFNNQLIDGIGSLYLQSTGIDSPRLTPLDGSPLLSGASFSDAYLADAFFTPVNYLGAFGEDNWTACWAEWDPQNQAYNGVVNNTITATIDASASAACEGSAVTLTVNTNATNGDIAWSNGQTEESIEAVAPATVFVTVTTANGCSAESAITEVEAYPIPTVNIVADGATSFCTGGSVTLTSTEADGNLWSTDETTSSITVTESDNYSLTYTDGNGCVALSNTISVSVSDSPVPTINTSGNTTICSGESVMLTASASDSYQWSLNGVEVANADDQSWEATATGAYTVTVTNTDACDGVGTSALVFVQVNPTPVSDFDYDFTFGGYTYEFNNNSTGATTYLWNFGDGQTSTEPNPTYTFTTGGTHTVTLSASNAGCDDVHTITINSVDVEENELVESINLYPNPVSENAILSLSLKGSADVSMTLYDVAGRIVFTNQLYNASGQQYVLIPMQNMSYGIYSLIIEAGDYNKAVKVMKN
ncbi:MAG: PKD domain-containing protein [Flavobacteriales bacterium]